MGQFDPEENSASIVTVTDKVRPLAIGMPVMAVHFLGDHAAFVGAEESVALVNAADEISKVEVHGGGILCATSDGTRLVTGGDDGKVVALNNKGEMTLLATDAKRRWIDNVALHPDGAVAWSVGKTAFVRGGKGEDKSFEVPSTVGGLAFAPKGLRRSRITTASRCGFPTWPPTPNSWNGRARISASCSRRTTNSWSPRCTSRRCMAGGSRISGTCA
jgi:WD40 repeat protein